MKNRKLNFFYSIRFKILFGFLAVSLVPIVFFAYTSYVQNNTFLRNAAVNELVETSKLNSKFIDNWFSYRKIDINTWAQNSSNVLFFKEIQELVKNSGMNAKEFVNSHEYTKLISKRQKDLVSISSHYHHVYDLFLIDLDSNILYSTLKEPDIGISLKDGELKDTKFAKTVLETIKDNKLYFSDMERYAPSANILSAFLSAPLIDDNGKTIGVFAVQLSLEKVFDLFSKKLYADGFSYYLVGQDGLLRSQINSYSDILNKNNIIDNTQFNNWKTNLKTNMYDSTLEKNIVNYEDNNGDTISSLYTTISILNTQWALVGEINLNKLLISENEYALKTVVFLIIIILIILLLSFKLSQQITRPIVDLVNATDHYTKANRFLSVNESSNSEAGHLVKAFNRMIKKLQENENELKSKTKIAQEALKSKSEFLASMSHEIRTPMNGVTGMLELLLNTDLNDTQKHHAYLAQSSANALLTLINDILDYSKVEAGKLEIDPHEFMIRDELGDFAESIAFKAQDKGVEFIIDASEVEYDRIIADKGRIRQILTNIVGNSIKFTNSGYILVKAKLEPQSDNKARLKVDIIDTGIGIPKEKIDQLFDSFTQVDASTTRKYGGTGLGLAIVKKLCNLMSGDVNVTSQFGSGSIFSVDIEVEIPENSKIVIPNIDVKNKKVLVIDKSRQSCEAVKNQLQRWAMDVSVVTDLEKAANMIKEEEFEVLFVDIKKSDMSGYELAKKTSKEYPKIKSVMMTPLSFSFNFDEEDEQFFDTNFPKPITTKDYMLALSILDGSKKRVIEEKNDENDLILEWPEDTNILVVEDNITNQIVLNGMLENFGLVADVANNGAEAIMSLKNSQKRYSIVLMDCQMPVMDGYEATKNIRDGASGDENINTPIVALTANAMVGDKEKCFSFGMDDYLSKPIDSTELLNMLKKWILKDFNVEEKSLSIKSEKKAWSEKEVLSRIGGSRELLKKVINIYLEDVNKDLELLKTAVENSDEKAVISLAHTIRGASSNLGALFVEDIAKEIEIDGLRDIKKLEDAIDEISKIFNEHLNKTSQVKTSKLEISDLKSKLKLIRAKLNSADIVDAQTIGILSIDDNEVINSYLEDLYRYLDTTEFINAIEVIDKIFEEI